MSSDRETKRNGSRTWPFKTVITKANCFIDQDMPSHYFLCVCVCERRSVVPDSLQPHGLWPASLLCPWNSPGKNTGVGCHSLLQTIFPAQGLNPVFCIAGRFFLSSKPLGKARLISTCKIPDTLIEGMREILKNLRNQPRNHGLGKGKEQACRITLLKYGGNLPI